MENFKERSTQVTWKNVTGTQKMTDYLLSKLEKPLAVVPGLNKHMQITTKMQKNTTLSKHAKSVVADSDDEVMHEEVRLAKDGKFHIHAQVVIDKEKIFCKATGDEFYAVVDLLEDKLKRVISSWHEMYAAHHSAEATLAKDVLRAVSLPQPVDNPADDLNREIEKENELDSIREIEAYRPRPIRHHHVNTKNLPQLTMEEAALYMQTHDEGLIYFIELDTAQPTIIFKGAEGHLSQVHFLG